MRRRKEGHIVNVASIAGLIGLPMMSAYCASKWALVGLTESLRRELYGSGITLTAFCPGSVDTPMTEAITRDPRMPRGVRIKTAEEVADKIVWATRRRARQVVFGEAPGALITASRFFTALTDWATYSLMRRLHPLGRRYLS
jgi:short-subunit dehydrogenase